MPHALSAKNPALRPRTASSSIGRLLSLAAGLCLAASVLILALDQPVAPLALTAALIGYIALPLRWPMLWLWVLPTVLTGIDLAPWTGRLLLDEFDLFVLATAASGLLAGRYGRGSWPSSPATRVVVAFWLMTILIALGRGLLPWSPLDATAWANTYMTPYNALRVGKGPLSAVVLLPLWLQLQGERGERANIQLVAGVCLGLTVCSFYVLCERGVLSALVALNPWTFIGNLLDFTSTYRATGNISQMHTGGSAIDGYLTMAFALSAAGLLEKRVSAYTMLAGVATLTGAYSITATLTRGTYGAAALSFLVLLLFALCPTGQPRRPQLPSWLFPTASVSYVVLLTLLRNQGGLFATLAIGAACLGGAIVDALRQRFTRWGYAVALALIATASAILSGHGMLDSRWTETPPAVAAALAEVSALVAVGVGTLAWRQTATVRIGGRILLVSLLSLLLPMAVFATWSYRMQERFATDQRDLQTRLSHWRQGLGLLEGRWQNWLLGIGMGAFPRAYILSTDAKSRVGTYLYGHEHGNTFLRLGGGSDLTLGQRLDIPQDETGPLVLSGEVRVDNRKATLSFGICRRHILEQEAWNPTCVSGSVRREGDQAIWQPFSRVLVIKKGMLPSDWLDLSFTVLRIGNFAEGTLLDVDNLSLRGRSGSNYLRNGDFSAGGDAWLSYDDFAHLAWHAKNVYVAILIDQGVLGLAGFFALHVLALGRARKPALSGDALAIGTLAMIGGWLTLGCVATLVDVPRNTFLYFFVLLAAAAAPPHPNGKSWLRGGAIRSSSAATSARRDG